MKFVCSPVTFAKFAPLMGAVAVGSLAFFASAESARAATVLKGFDYLATPAIDGGTNFTFTGLGTVSFKGLPINQAVSGLADTVVERTKDVLATPATASLSVDALIAGTLSSDYVTPIVIRNLSLMSLDPVSGYDVFVGLDPSKTSGGEMAIAHDPLDTLDTGGIWSSYFGIHGIAVLVPETETLDLTEPNFVKDLIADEWDSTNKKCNTNTYQCIQFSKGFGFIGEVNTGSPFKAENEPWSHSPGPDQIEGPDSSNFYLTGEVLHDSGDATHTVTPRVPEPLTVLGSLVGLGTILKLKKNRNLKHKP